MSDPSLALQEDPASGGEEPDAGLPAKQANRSLWGDAWYELRRNPIFWFAVVLVVLVVSMALFPSLWTNRDPAHCLIQDSKQPPGNGHWLGFSYQGCDMWAKVVYGTRESLAVAVLATIFTTLIGTAMGTMAGFYPGLTDTIISRITDVFFGLPFLLGAIVFLSLFNERNVVTITAVLTVLGWTSLTRIMRGSVLSTKNKDYVDASRALGAKNRHIIFKHILPNAISPVIVLSTIALGGYISAEATLTFLGVGFQQPNTTWGLLVQEGAPWYGSAPHLLLIPCAFIVATVLAFILLGDALRDALDPRIR